jgi:hypothetical protein
MFGSLAEKAPTGPESEAAPTPVAWSSRNTRLGGEHPVLDEQQ